MTNDLDTLPTALYGEIDDHVVPPRRGRGRQPKLSDAELVCPAVAQVLLGARGEHHRLRACYARLPHLFPSRPKQPGYHKRPKAAAPLLAAAVGHLARHAPSWYDPVRLIDATPLPCGTVRETVKRSQPAGWATYGYGAAHSRWYWGLTLYLITAPDGMPVAWCLADPKIGEREVAAALLAHAARTDALRTGLPLSADKGLAGRGVEEQVASGFGVRLVRPDRRDEPARHRSIGGIRQWIASVNDALTGRLDLERHGGRTPVGVYVRVAQRLLALASVVWHDWATGAADKRSLIAYDH